MTLSGVPGEDDSRDLLDAAFSRSGLGRSAPQRLRHQPHPAAERPPSWADYSQAGPATFTPLLKRKSGKLHRRARPLRPRGLGAYEAIYAKQLETGRRLAAVPRRFAEQEGAAGRLRLGIARADGRPVAAQLWTVEGSTAFIHKLAHAEAAKFCHPALCQPC